MKDSFTVFESIFIRVVIIVHQQIAVVSKENWFNESHAVFLKVTDSVDVSNVPGSVASTTNQVNVLLTGDIIRQ